MTETKDILSDPEMIREFITEARELLINVDNDLIRLESNQGDVELLNRIFRAIHNLKGTSGFLGFHQLVALSHGTEDVLHMLRTGDRVVDAQVIDSLFEATAILKRMLKCIEERDDSPIETQRLWQSFADIKAGHIGMPRKTGKRASAPQKAKVSAGTKMGTRTKARTKTNTNTNTKGRSTNHNTGTTKKTSVSQAQNRSVAGSQQVCSIPMGSEVDSRTIRVDVDRLDDLMNLVGELVIERNKLIRSQRELAVQRDPDAYAQRVANIAENLNFLTNELQLSLLKARMMPVYRLFRKLPRMVRDLAADMKKEVDLIISGGDTELDKQVMDQLMKPLIHILRNAVDHGIESAEVRQRKGKPVNGKIYLSASQEGNHIVVRVKDDGRGLNLEEIRLRALKKGLVSKNQIARMSKWEVIQLVFEPGFSTALSTGDLSGRGVGLDVVKTHVRRLNGVLDVRSEEDEGTEIIVKLPLTLAIMQALMVQVREEVYAIPMATVIETMQVEQEALHHIEGKWSIHHRDGLLPLFQLDHLCMNGPRDEASSAKKMSGGRETDHGMIGGYIVLVGVAEKRFGIVVDELMGEEDLVIKTLGETLGSLSGIVGGTITGDGRVRLIVDCGTLADLLRVSERPDAAEVPSHYKMKVEPHE